MTAETRSARRAARERRRARRHEFWNTPIPKKYVVPMVLSVILGGTLGFAALQSETNARHDDVCGLARTFLHEQRIAEAPSVAPPGSDQSLRDLIAQRNQIRARSLRTVERKYAEVCG